MESIEISEIESTPGFLLPDAQGNLLRDTNRPEYDRLEKLRDTAYRANAPEVSEQVFDTVEEAETAMALGTKPKSNVEPMQQQSELITEAKVEMDKLVKLGFPREEIPIDIPDWKVNVLHLHRLTAEQNYLELKPLIAEQLKTFEASPLHTQAFDSFINMGDLDETLKEDITRQIVKYINRANKQKSGDNKV